MVVGLVDKRREPHVVVSAYLPFRLFERLTKFAEERGLTISGAVRMAVELVVKEVERGEEGGAGEEAS